MAGETQVRTRRGFDLLRAETFRVSIWSLVMKKWTRPGNVPRSRVSLLTALDRSPDVYNPLGVYLIGEPIRSSTLAFRIECNTLKDRCHRFVGQ